MFGGWGWGGQRSSPFLPNSQRGCGGSRRWVFIASQRSPVYKTLPRTFSQPPACVPAWQSPRSHSLSDLSFEFCPSHSLNSFPFLWACITESTAIRDSDSSPNTLQRARARRRSPLRMMDGGRSHAYQARPCAGAFARGVSPRCSGPVRRSSQAPLHRS